MENVKTQEECWKQLNAELKKITQENRNFYDYSLFKQPNKNENNNYGNGVFTSFLKFWPDELDNKPENFVAVTSSESTSGNGGDNHFSLFSQLNETWSDSPKEIGHEVIRSGSGRTWSCSEGIWKTTKKPSLLIESKDDRKNSHAEKIISPLFQSGRGTTWELEFDTRVENLNTAKPSESPLWDESFAASSKPQDFWERFDFESYDETTVQKSQDINPVNKFPGKTNNMHCSFCQKNQEPIAFYKSHNLKDKNGYVTCPILKTYICPRCGATGRNAHTVKYCKIKNLQ